LGIYFVVVCYLLQSLIIHASKSTTFRCRVVLRGVPIFINFRWRSSSRLDSFPTRRSSDLLFGWWGFDPIIVDSAQVQRESTMIEIGKHTSELQSRGHLVCRLLPEKNKP